MVDYPCDFDEQMMKFTKSTLVVPALDIAERIGSPKLLGTVILGAFSAFQDIPEAHWEQALRERVPKKTIDMNLRVFKAGHDVAARAQ